MRALWVGTQELAIARVLVVEQQCRVEFGHYVAQEIMGEGGIFFDVVGDQVAICAEVMLRLRSLIAVVTS